MKNRIIFLSPTGKSTGGNLVLKLWIEILQPQFSISVIFFDSIKPTWLENSVDIIHIKNQVPRKINLVFLNLFLLRKLNRIIYSDDKIFIVPIFGILIPHAILLKKRFNNSQIVYLAQDSFKIRYFGFFIYQIYFRFNFIFSDIDKVICVSKSLFDFFSKNTPASQIEYLPNCIMIDDKFRDKNFKKKSHSILFIGGVAKGFFLFLQVVKLLKKEYKIYCVYTGKDIMKFRKLFPNIVFYQTLEHTKLLELYADSFIYLSLSLNESFGLPVLEAMYLNCLVIARENDGLYQFYTENDPPCVLISKNATITEIVAKINRAMLNLDDSKKIIKKGHAVSEQYLYSETYSKKLMNSFSI